MSDELLSAQHYLDQLNIVGSGQMDRSRSRSRMVSRERGRKRT